MIIRNNLRHQKMGHKTYDESDQEWSDWTYYTTKDAVGYVKKANTKATYARYGYKVATKAKPYVAKLAPAGKAALRAGGKAVVKVAPSAGAWGTKAASVLGPIASASAPIAAVVLTAAAMASAVEHYGGRTYIEDEMRWIEHTVFGRKQGKAPPPRI